MAGQQLYTDGSPHQTDTQHRGGHHGDSMGTECGWRYGHAPGPTGFGAGDAGRCRSAVVAGQHLHTDGGAHQADIKYRGDYPGGALAAECIRGFVGNSIYSHRESVVLLALSSEHKGNP